MKKIPLDLNLSLTEAQQGALLAKSNIKEIFKRLNEINYGDQEEDYDYGPALLENRTAIISDLIKSLGNLSELQLGYISSLLEFAEIHMSGSDEVNSWVPSLISGKWS